MSSPDSEVLHSTAVYRRLEDIRAACALYSSIAGTQGFFLLRTCSAQFCACGRSVTCRFSSRDDAVAQKSVELLVSSVVSALSLSFLFILNPRLLTPSLVRYPFSLQPLSRSFETVTPPSPRLRQEILSTNLRRHRLADPNQSPFPPYNKQCVFPSVRTQYRRAPPTDVSILLPLLRVIAFLASPTPRLPRQQCRPLPRLRLTPVPATLVRATRPRRAARASRRARRTATRRSTRLTSGALPTA